MCHNSRRPDVSIVLKYHHNHDTYIRLRAKKNDITVEVIHNTSVMGAVASCGLPLYQYGYTVSIPLFEENWKPSSFYSRIKYNRDGGMHTLCLLDIKVSI